MSSPVVIDGRGLQPPAPMELTFAALDKLGKGEELTLLLNCQPFPLYQILRREGYTWQEQWDDGTCAIRIRKP